MKHFTYKKTIQKILAVFLILILNCNVMSTTAFAEAAVASDPGRGTASNSTGQNTGSIKNAIDAGIREEDIKNAIAENFSLSEEDATKVYNACYDDTTKITVNYTVVASGAAAGNVTFGSIESNLTDEDISAIQDGTYNSNLATDQANAGTSRDDSATTSEEENETVFGLLASPLQCY